MVELVARERPAQALKIFLAACALILFAFISLIKEASIGNATNTGTFTNATPRRWEVIDSDLGTYNGTMKLLLNTQGHLLARSSPYCTLCHRMNGYGFGSDIHTFGQVMWHAKLANNSCAVISGKWIWDPNGRIFDAPRSSTPCPLVNAGEVPEWSKPLNFKSIRIDKHAARAMATQNMFSWLRPEVYVAAEQVDIYAAINSSVNQLVSVHIRWGDKGDEMKSAGGLQPVEAYIDGVRKLTRDDPRPVNVFLMSESNNAIRLFRDAAPVQWNVLTYDAAVNPLTRQLNVTMEKSVDPKKHARSDPEAGWHAVIALILTMQADKIVITSGSNWSRLIEELCMESLTLDAALGGAVEVFWKGVSRCSIIDTTPARPSDWRKV